MLNRSFDNTKIQVWEIDKEKRFDLYNNFWSKLVLYDENGNDIYSKWTEVIVSNTSDDKARIDELWAKPVLVSWIDLFHFDWFTYEEIQEIIEKNILYNNSLDKSSWISEFLYMFDRVYWMFRRKIESKIYNPKKIELINNYFFDNENLTKEDIIDFFRLAWLINSKKIDREYSEIAKNLITMMMCLSDIQKFQAKSKEAWIDMEEEKDRLHNIMSKYFGGVKSGRVDQVRILGDDYVLFGRSKSIDWQVTKSQTQLQYARSEDILDNQWFTFVPKKPVSLAQTIKNMVHLLFILEKEGYQLEGIKVKWIRKSKIESCNLSVREREILKNISYEKKSATSKSYQDIKILLRYMWKLQSLECRFTLFPLSVLEEENNSNCNIPNEKWLSFSWVYSGKSKIVDGYFNRNTLARMITDNQLNTILGYFPDYLEWAINDSPFKQGMTLENYLKWELWEDMQSGKFVWKDNKPLIRPWIKFDNRSVEENISKYIIPWFAEYFKTKLISVVDWKWIINPKWIEWYRSERSYLLWEIGFYKEAIRKAIK